MAAERELEMGEYRVLGGAVLVASKKAFAAWMRTAMPGSRCIYARATALPMGQPGCIEQVRARYEAGDVDLVQRRMPLPPAGPGGFAYLAIRRGVPPGGARKFVARASRGRVTP